MGSNDLGVEFIGKSEVIEAYKTQNRKSKWASVIDEFIKSRKPAMKIPNKKPAQFRKTIAKYPQLVLFGRGNDTFVVNKEIVDLSQVWVSDITK